MLSTYPSDILTEYTKANGWHTIELDKVLSASNGAVMKERKRKVEVLTANYDIRNMEGQSGQLFSRPLERVKAFD